MTTSKQVKCPKKRRQEIKDEDWIVDTAVDSSIFSNLHGPGHALLPAQLCMRVCLCNHLPSLIQKLVNNFAGNK